MAKVSGTSESAVGPLSSTGSVIRVPRGVSKSTGATGLSTLTGGSVWPLDSTSGPSTSTGAVVKGSQGMLKSTGAAGLSTLIGSSVWSLDLTVGPSTLTGGSQEPPHPCPKPIQSKCPTNQVSCETPTVPISKPSSPSLSTSPSEDESDSLDPSDPDYIAPTKSSRHTPTTIKDERILGPSDDTKDDQAKAAILSYNLVDICDPPHPFLFGTFNPYKERPGGAWSLLNEWRANEFTPFQTDCMIPIGLCHHDLLPSCINTNPTLTTSSPFVTLSNKSTISSIVAYGGCHRVCTVELAQDDIQKILTVKKKKLNKARVNQDDSKKAHSSHVDIDSIKAEIVQGKRDIHCFKTWGVIVYDISNIPPCPSILAHPISFPQNWSSSSPSVSIFQKIHNASCLLRTTMNTYITSFSISAPLSNHRACHASPPFFQNTPPPATNPSLPPSFIALGQVFEHIPDALAEVSNYFGLFMYISCST